MSKAITGRYARHGMSNTRLYRAWHSMKERCRNPKDGRYANYGGRGICVCDEWKHDFQAFHDWAMASGYSESLSLDRIDVNKGYSPDNCRWITMKEQQYNKRTNRFLTHNGKTQTLTQWGIESGISPHTLLMRLQRGWSTEKALAKKV